MDRSARILPQRWWVCRGRLRVLLLIPIVALSTYVTARAITELPVVPDLYSVPAAKPDHRGTEQQPLVISKTPEELSQENAHEAVHVKNENIMMVATVVLALFTVALWMANIWLIVESRRVSASQAEDTRTAIAEAKRSADAMHEVAEATKNNAILMSGMFAKQMRAYISVDIGSAIYQDPNLRFEAMPTLTNNGLTPARNVCYKALAGILDGTQPTALTFTDIGELVINDVGIAPRQSFTIRGLVPDRVPDDDVSPIMIGNTRRLFTWGRVTYADVYGGSWETNFCISYWFVKVGENVKVFGNFYSKHNNAT